MRLLLLCIMLLNIYCKTHREDIPPDDTKRPKFSFLNISKLKEIRVKQISEEELYQIFGEDVNIRMTFNPVIPKRYNGHFYPVDKVILYFDSKGKVVKGKGFTEYVNNEFLSVAFNLYKGKLQFFSIRYEIGDKLSSESTEDAIEFFKLAYGSLWPYQECDIHYYERYVIKKDPMKWAAKPSLDWKNYGCDYDVPNLEEVLKADGYYDRL